MTPLWKLPKELEDAHDVIEEFFYSNAPSLPLLDSILDLHFDQIEVVQLLCDQVAVFSSQLVETFNRSKGRSASHLDGKLILFEQTLISRYNRTLHLFSSDPPFSPNFKIFLNDFSLISLESSIESSEHVKHPNITI